MCHQRHYVFDLSIRLCVHTCMQALADALSDQLAVDLGLYLCLMFMCDSINEAVNGQNCCCSKHKYGTVCAAQQQQLGADVPEAKPAVAAEDSQLDAMDRACILTAVALFASCLIIAIILSKCTSHWHFRAGMCHLYVVLQSLIC